MIRRVSLIIGVSTLLLTACNNENIKDIVATDSTTNSTNESIEATDDIEVQTRSIEPETSSDIEVDQLEFEAISSNETESIGMPDEYNDINTSELTIDTDYYLDASVKDIAKDSAESKTTFILTSKNNDIETADLIYNDESTLVYIGELINNGDTEYKLDVTIDNKEEGNRVYFAVVKKTDGTQIRTSDEEVFVYTPFTDEELSNLNLVNDEMTKLRESDEYRNSTNVDERLTLVLDKLHELESKKLVSRIRCEKDDPHILVYYESMGVQIGEQILDWNERIDSEGNIIVSDIITNDMTK